MKVPNPEEEVDRILEQVDKNNSGFIDYHGKYIKKNLLCQQLINKIF